MEKNISHSKQALRENVSLIVNNYLVTEPLVFTAVLLENSSGTKVFCGENY